MLASAPAAAAAGQPAPGPVPAATLTDAELSKKTIPELKKLCAAAGLKVGGNKSQLTIRLLGLDPAAPPKMRGSSKKVDVDAVLRASGIADLHRVNPCLKAAIAKGFIPMKDGKLDLEAELCSGRCLVCSNQMVATVQDVLYQRAVGDDVSWLMLAGDSGKWSRWMTIFAQYEDGNEGGALQCFGPRDSDDEEEEDLDGETHGIYITDLCVGRPSFSDGKFHQHCTECPGYGKCIGELFLSSSVGL